MFFHPAEQDASSTRWGGRGRERKSLSHSLCWAENALKGGDREREREVGILAKEAAGKSENPVACADDDCG